MASENPMTSIHIDGIPLGGERVYVIAEVGNNHNGSVALAQLWLDIKQEEAAAASSKQLAAYGASRNGCVIDIVKPAVADRRGKALFQVPGFVQTYSDPVQLAANQVTVHAPTQGDTGMQQIGLRLLRGDFLALLLMQAP